MKQTIASIQPEPSFWQKEDKSAYFVNGRFADNSELSVWNNSEAQAKEVIATLTALIGQEAEYEVDGKKLKSWPGKPAGKSGGSFGGQPAWRNSKEGAWFEAVARAVNTAVMQSDSPARAKEWLDWSITQLTNLSNRPATPTNPSSSQPGSGSPAKPSPGAGRAERPSGGRGGAVSIPAGENAAASTSPPTGQTRPAPAVPGERAAGPGAPEDGNPWDGMDVA